MTKRTAMILNNIFVGILAVVFLWLDHPVFALLIVLGWQFEE